MKLSSQKTLIPYKNFVHLSKIGIAAWLHLELMDTPLELSNSPFLPLHEFSVRP